MHHTLFKNISCAGIVATLEMLGYLLAHITYFVRKRVEEEHNKRKAILFSLIPLAVSVFLMASCILKYYWYINKFYGMVYFYLQDIVFASEGYVTVSCSEPLPAYLVLLLAYSIIMAGFSVTFIFGDYDNIKNLAISFIFYLSVFIIFDLLLLLSLHRAGIFLNYSSRTYNCCCTRFRTRPHKKLCMYLITCYVMFISSLAKNISLAVLFLRDDISV